MAEFTHRQDRPGPFIQYATVRFPGGESDLGTGTYEVAVESSALGGDRPVAAVLINRPVFQLALELNPQTREAVVTFGRADGAEPAIQSVFRLPEAARGTGAAPIVFLVSFEGWVVTGVKSNGRDLEKIGPRPN
jgi:hypothetical protein